MAVCLLYTSAYLSLPIYLVFHAGCPIYRTTFSVSLPANLLALCRYACLCVCPSVCLPTPICLPVYLFVYLLQRISVCQSVCCLAGSLPTDQPL